MLLVVIYWSHVSYYWTATVKDKQLNNFWNTIVSLLDWSLCINATNLTRSGQKAKPESTHHTTFYLSYTISLSLNHFSGKEICVAQSNWGIIHSSKLINSCICSTLQLIKPVRNCPAAGSLEWIEGTCTRAPNNTNLGVLVYQLARTKRLETGKLDVVKFLKT